MYRYKKPVPHNYIIGHISFDFCPRSSCFTDRMRLSGNTHPPSPRGRCCEDSVRNCRGSQSLHLFNLSSTFGRSIKRFHKLFVSVIAGSAIGSSLFFPWKMLNILNKGSGRERWRIEYFRMSRRLVPSLKFDLFSYCFVIYFFSLLTWEMLYRHWNARFIVVADKRFWTQGEIAWNFT